MNPLNQVKHFDLEAQQQIKDWCEDNSFAGRREFEVFLETLNLPFGSRLLEMGCGTGRYTLPLLERGYSVDGVDISEKSLDVLHRSYNANRHGGWGELRTVAQLPERGEFDGVVCVNLLHHLEDPAKSVKIFVNLLRAGGVLLVFEPNPLCVFWHFYFLYRRIWQLEKGILKTSKNRLRQMFIDAGLKEITDLGYGLVPTRFLGRFKSKSLFDLITLRLANAPILGELSFHHLTRGVKS